MKAAIGARDQVVLRSTYEAVQQTYALLYPGSFHELGLIFSLQCSNCSESRHCFQAGNIRGGIPGHWVRRVLQ